MAVPNRGPELFAVCVTLLAASVVAFSLRVYTRLVIVKAWGMDDWFMAFATISFILFVASAITGIHYGTGRHYADLDDDDIKEAMKYWWFCYIWYCLTMISSKISIGVFLLRLTVSKMHHRIIYVVMLLTVASGIVFFFVTLFQCTPIPYFWDRDIAGGKCIDTKIIAALTYLYSAFSVICDFTFAILPMFLIYQLQIDRRTKVALIPILSIGCVASIAVVVRLGYINRFLDPDFLWATLDIAIWSTSEQGLAITAASLATLRPLFRTVGQRFGMWTPRASMPLSDDALPRTIGSTDKFKERRAAAKRFDDISLGTFIQKDDEEAAVNCTSDGKSLKQAEHGSKIYATTTISVSSDSNTEGGAVPQNKRNSAWGMGRGRRCRAESEEKLNPQPSKEAMDDFITVPRSFFIIEGPLLTP
ncbi:hypothetical protein O1611_g1652 [Lasiodiplodia mahajangana]|uniref:Uncharacterized protein n=1 Tax=Lasiodiplodia mahajangana TaxID=1108764 RepID=A0ACC2JXC1_9PEZI|nr:hypothetical protein O1611_g1652 [Lasiodiplodia mahajangana]